MAYNRVDLRSEIRVNLNETTADLWQDTDLDKFINAEIRSLPRKGIYLEEIYEIDTVINQEEYSLPTNTHKVERVERNWGTASAPRWDEIKGWDNYAGALYLSPIPDTVFTIRVFVSYGFATLSDDVTAIEVPDEKIDVVIWGATVRAYKALMGYFVDAKNWDAIAKPDGISMNQVLNWYKEAKDEYKDILKTFRTIPRPRDIDLVN